MISGEQPYCGALYSVARLSSLYQIALHGSTHLAADKLEVGGKALHCGERILLRGKEEGIRKTRPLANRGLGRSDLEKVVGLTSFVIILVFIASFSPAQGERNQR